MRRREWDTISFVEGYVRIEKIDLFEVSIPLRTPFKFGSVTQTHRDHLFARVSAEGLHGWGESGLLRWPYYNSEATTTAFTMVKEFLAPALMGETVEAALTRSRFKEVVGNQMAKASLNFALWDLLAKSKSEPLWRLLGGTSAPISIGVSIGIQDDDGALLDVVQGFLDRGFTRVKYKISPTTPFAPLLKCREHFPDVLMSVDANSSFAGADSTDLLPYDALRLAMIEQPFAPKQLVRSAALQRIVTTPVCLDESIEELSDLENAVELKSARSVNIKPARVGGISGALEIASGAARGNWSSWVGGLLETGIGRAHNLAFASTIKGSFPHDISPCRRHSDVELIEEEFALQSDGTLALPAGAGIGVTVNENQLKSFTIRHTEVS